MGLVHTPRHRAEVPRQVKLANLRRGLATLLAGRDLYADDRILRPDVPDRAARAPATDELWKALPPPATRPARRPHPA